MLRLNSRFWLLLGLLLVLVTSNAVFAQATFEISVTHTGNASAGDVDFLINSTDGIVEIFVLNNSGTPTSGTVTVEVPLPGGLTFNTLVTTENVTFLCAGGGTSTATCTTNDVFAPNLSARLELSVNAPSTPSGSPFTFSATVNGGGAASPASDTDDVGARVVAPSIDLVIVNLTH